MDVSGTFRTYTKVGERPKTCTYVETQKMYVLDRREGLKKGESQQKVCACSFGFFNYDSYVSFRGIGVI